MSKEPIARIRDNVVQGCVGSSGQSLGRGISKNYPFLNERSFFAFFTPLISTVDTYLGRLNKSSGKAM